MPARVCFHITSHTSSGVPSTTKSNLWSCTASPLFVPQLRLQHLASGVARQRRKVTDPTGHLVVGKPLTGKALELGGRYRCPRSQDDIGGDVLTQHLVPNADHRGLH